MSSFTDEIYSVRPEKVRVYCKTANMIFSDTTMTRPGVQIITLYICNPRVNTALYTLTSAIVIALFLYYSHFAGIR